MPLPAKISGCAFASATVSGSSGQPGVNATYPACSNSSTQGCQLDGSSQSPWTKTTGVAVDAFARSTCSCSWSPITCGSAVEADMLLLASGVAPVWLPAGTCRSGRDADLLTDAL